MRTFEEITVGQGMGLLFAPLEEEPTDLSEMGLGFWTIVVVRTAAPECLLVQLYLFFIGAPIHHSSQMGVAYGQGFEPMGCGTVVPQAEVV